MRYRIFDKRYKYFYYFDTENGNYIRTGIIDEKGKDTGIDPFMGSFPHLIDIGIMGHCIHGKTGLCIMSGVECYQDGLNIVKDNMSLENFKWIIKQCERKTNQVALGGRGDPDQHENFEEIIKECRKYNIIPSYTTSGLGLTKELAELSKEYCGAVAVSWYRSDHTIKAINRLLEIGVKTSIHYVLANNSIDEAIDRLKNDTFPKGITTLIFLLHKPKGLGSQRNVLKVEDPRVKELMNIIDNKILPFQVGFDSCTVPALHNFTKNILIESIEPCEGARFSCYISDDMIMTPCSFDTERDFGVKLGGENTITKVWNSETFDKFRYQLKHRCPTCKIRKDCMGGCPLMKEIVICNKEEMNLDV